MRRLLALLAGALILSALGLVSPVLAQAESLEISQGAEPTQDVPVSITVSGMADGHHKLYVFVNTFGGCSSSPQDDGGSPLANGTSLSEGSFEKSYSYTPTQVQTYTLCAYLDENEFATPDVTVTNSFTAMMPSASATIEISGKLTQEIPMKIKVSGTTEVARRLYVFVNSFGGCSSLPQDDGGSLLANGTSLSAGAYSGEYSYTPTAIQSYAVCAYIDESEFATPDATATSNFAAATPAASVSFVVSPTSTENRPVTVKVSGTTEVARRLYVFVNSFGGCSSLPQDDGGSLLANGTSLSAGAYSGEYSYTPTSSETYTVCGYVDESEFATPDATGTSSFTNVTPKTRAEQAEKAAGQAVYESEAAAAARKLSQYLQGVAEREHCNQLPDEYAASVGICEADEAALRDAHEAEWNNLEATDLAKPVGSLSVRAIARPGRSSQHPGSTVLRITASPFAHITIKLRHYGHRTERYEARPISLHSQTGTLEPEYPWTCSRPGGRYTYIVTARTRVGRTITRTGHFDPVSTARCHALERSEQEARERSARRYAEETRRAREAEEALQREGEFNCRQRGGTVVQLYVEGEPRLGCRAPGGGLLPWIS